MLLSPFPWRKQGQWEGRLGSSGTRVSFGVLVVHGYPLGYQQHQGTLCCAFCSPFPVPLTHSHFWRVAYLKAKVRSSPERYRALHPIRAAQRKPDRAFIKSGSE